MTGPPPSRAERERARAARVLGEWIERDLTAAAVAGELAPAYEVDDVVDRLCELVAVGRHPIVIGEPGVGKTAVIHEVVRRAVAGDAPEALAGRRILQFSLRHRLASLKDPKRLGKALWKLVDALAALPEPVIPYIRDVHLAYHFELESHLETLAFRLAGPVLGEGDRVFVRALFEFEPDLEQSYQMVDLPEPPIDRVQRIAARWALQREAAGVRFTPRAIEETVFLAHRFLARARHPRKSIELLEQLGRHAEAGTVIDVPQVVERFCQGHRVPRALVDPTAPIDLDAMERRFRDCVHGQPEAVDAVVRMIGLIKSGLSDPRRAFGVFLFVGPTGVGKTHLAHQLADELFGDAQHLVRFNMADFPDEDAAELLFGDPANAALPQVRGMLTQRLLGHPFAVLLLDEFEKAHARIHDRFMQMFDEGQFVNAAGETVSCRSMVIIATSNVGSEVYRERRFGFESGGDEEALARELEHRLEGRFRVEFLNRFDRVVRFHPLGRASIRAIAQRELDALGARAGLHQHGHVLEVDDAVLDWLAEAGYDPRYGARFLRRAIDRYAVTAIAERLVRDRPDGARRLRLSLTPDGPVAELRPVDETPAPTAADPGADAAGEILAAE